MPINRIHSALVCFTFTIASVTGAQSIDFETLPSGAPTTDNMLIDAQYEAEYGVRFSLVEKDGTPVGFPRIAKVGAPLTAFVSCAGDDTPDSGLGIGDSFLTDDGALGNSADLLIEYVSPVAQASGVILDVDARSSDPGAVESWMVRAYSPSGVLVAVTEIIAPQGPDEPGCEGFNGEGDGSARGFSFQRAIADIACIQFTYTGSAELGSVGLAFDNFSPSTAVEELQIELMFEYGGDEFCEGNPIFLTFETSGGFSDQSVRWERRLSPNDPWEETSVSEIDGEYFPVNGEEIRAIVNDGSDEVASDPVRIDFDNFFFGLVTGDLVIEDAGLFLFQNTEAPDVWGEEPTSFENDEIETVSEGVHVLPMLTASGAHLAMVYNTTGGTTPGTATTEIITDGFEPDIIFLDDPDDPMYNDTYTEELLAPGVKRFIFDQTWAGDKTDGFIIGPMVDSGTFTITIYDSSGLSTGRVFTRDGDPIPFSFTDGMELTLENSCSAQCPADLNNDNELDFIDISAFLGAYTNLEPLADLNEDGNYDFIDISAFLGSYSSGCP